MENSTRAIAGEYLASFDRYGWAAMRKFAIEFYRSMENASVAPQSK
jgi:hypothetical protein